MKVVHIQAVQGSSVLRGFADVEVWPEVIIRGFRILNSPEGLHVAVPEIKIYNARGQRTFLSMLQVPRKLMEEINRVVLEAWQVGGAE